MLSDRFNWYKEIENREKQNNWTLDIPWESYYCTLLLWWLGSLQVDTYKCEFEITLNP
jgi:hypothetical protein